MSTNVGNVEVLDRENSTEQEIKKENINLNDIFYICVKRIVGIIAGIVGVIILIPTTIILYIARIILKENNGPLFYTQLRVGKNGREFVLYKYRSMCMDADDKLYEYLEQNPKAKEEYQKYKKLQNDPRVTKLGKFIRKTSIDELPQLINVLKGDMNLVGPRPYLHKEIKDMGDKYYKIISVKPGLTGYWQVNGRSNTDFEKRLQMDCDYIDTRNLWSDFKFLLKTFLIIFKKDGAI